jgi:sugar/nucleoside kinase (ribokinase family)
MNPELVTAGCICADVMVRPVDEVPARGTLGLVPSLELHLGGLAGVTAAVFAQLGGRAAFAGGVGQDAFGSFLLNDLAGRGVDVSRVRRVGGAGSSATVVLISSTGERTFMHHLGTNASLCPEDLDLDFIAQARVFHWGGPGLTPAFEAADVARVFEVLRARGVLTSLDTCFDGAGRWGERLDGVLGHLDIAMTNMEEGRRYTGMQNPERIAGYFLELGAQRVLVKLGERGCFVADGAVQRYLPAFDVEVVDTTGAGDAACGGFLYGVVQGWDVLRCGLLANAVGAMTVQCMGGAEAGCSLEDALAMMGDAAAGCGCGEGGCC